MNKKVTVVLSGHQTKLSASLYQLQQQGYMCDCIIKTRDGDVNTHRVVLFSRGGKFLQEQIINNHDGCCEINLQDEQYSDVLPLIKLVYTGEVTLDRTSIHNLHRLCALLEFSEGVQACKSYLQRNQTSSGELPDTSDLCSPKTDNVDKIFTVDSVPGYVTTAQHHQEQNQHICLRETTVTGGTESDTDISHTECVELNEKLSATESIDAHGSLDSLTKLIIHGKTRTKLDSNQGVVTTKVLSKDEFSHTQYDLELKRARSNKDVEESGSGTKRSNTKKSKGNICKYDDRKSTSIKSRIASRIKDRVKVRDRKVSALSFDDESETVPCQKCCRTEKHCNCSKKIETGEITKGEKYKCVLCKETFEDSEALAEHKRNEHSLVCSECCWRTNKGCYLAGHMYAQHGKLYNAEKYPLIHCDHPGCDFKSVKKHAVKVHKTSHTNERHYRCKCGSAFKLKSVYNAHLKSHEPEQLKYECEICGKGFIRPSNLKEHKKVHAENTELCHLCPWSSKSRRELHIHMLRVHNIPVPKHIKVLRCNLCDYYTFTSFLLRNHMDLHSNERKYQCQICGKVFENESRLKRHLKSHDDTEQKEFHCPHEGCSYKTIRKPCLQVHIDAKHSEYKPFQCHLCDYRCKIKGNMDKHLRGTHKMEVITIRKLWKQVLDTGEGYGSIVHRLKGFKTKGAVGMANAVDEDEEDILTTDQIIEQE